MPETCAGLAGEPTTAETARELYDCPAILDDWITQFKKLDLPEQLVIYDEIKTLELWLWSNNAALKCLEFAQFVMNLAEQLWAHHRRSVQFREDMFLDNLYGPEWGSW